MICKVNTKSELRALLNSILSDQFIEVCDYEWEYDALEYILEEIMSDDVKSELNGCFNTRVAEERKLRYGEHIPEAVVKALRKRALDSVFKLDSSLFPLMVLYSTDPFEDIPVSVRVFSAQKAVSVDDFKKSLDEEVRVYGPYRA